ncbi:MAG: helix-turn-helix domain containing protein, partial [Ignavibacteria bacterium]|nr:helix-turn-helix domain containing protein [Ignavibacteria bacterium]
MKDSENQQKFIDLRLQGVSIPKVADKLGISLSTAKRWNRTYKDDILSIKNEELMNNKKIFFAKYDEMFEFLDSHLSRLKDHLQNNNEIFMSYEKTLLASLKIIDALNKIQSLKKMISESNHTDLLNSFSLFKNPGDEPESVPENQITTLTAPSTTHNAPSTTHNALSTDKAPSTTHNAPSTDKTPSTTHNAPSTD